MKTADELETEIKKLQRQLQDLKMDVEAEYICINENSTWKGSFWITKAFILDNKEAFTYIFSTDLYMFYRYLTHDRTEMLFRVKQ